MTEPMYIELPRPSDYHVHLRQDDMLALVGPLTGREFGKALVMPNTLPAIRTADEVHRYRKEVEYFLGKDCQALMTIKLTEATTHQTIREACRAGVVAAKLYPKGATSNSDDGIPISWLKDQPVSPFYGVLAAMEELGMVLCMHGEMSGTDYRSFDSPYDPSYTRNRIRYLGPTNRIGCFMEWVTDILSPTFPKLRKVVEHITTRFEVEMIREQVRLGNKIAGTITPHHLHIIHEDIIGATPSRPGTKLRPHNYCLPVAKFHEDRTALREAATSGEACFFLGTDSAPWITAHKECDECCAGIFNATTAVPFLIDLFINRKASNHLANFMTYNGDRFYGLQPTKAVNTYKHTLWKVPERYENGPITVRPFMAGQLFSYQLNGQ